MSRKLTESDKSRQLTPQQELALDALLAGKTDAEAAEAAGVTRQTVNRWKNSNPVFIATMNRRREELWVAVQDRLRQLLFPAIAVLEEALHAEDLKLRVETARYLLKALGIDRLDFHPHGAKTPKEVTAEKEWEQLLENIGFGS